MSMVDNQAKVHKDGPDVIKVETGGKIQRSRTRFINGSIGHVGGAAGWAVGNNTGVATVAASQSAGKFVIPLFGLNAGDKITGFKVVAQIESAGGTVTLDADLRKETNAAADPTDASVGAITQVSVTADTAVAASKTGLAEVVASGTHYYVLLTATTAASTDIQLLGIELDVDEDV